MLRDLTSAEFSELLDVVEDAAAGVEPSPGLRRLAAENLILKSDNARLLLTLRGLRAWCMPGMDWTDEIGQEVLRIADEAIARATATREGT